MLLLFVNCNKSRFVNIAANNFISLEYLANKAISMALVRSTPLQNEAHLAGPVSKKYVVPFVGKAFSE